jgi:spore germination protein YaaH
VSRRPLAPVLIALLALLTLLPVGSVGAADPSATPLASGSPIPSEPPSATSSATPTATPATTAMPAATPAAAAPETDPTGGELPAPPDGMFDEPSTHAQMLAEHAGDDLEFAPGGAPAITLDAGGVPIVKGSVTVSGVDATIEAAGGSTAALPNGLRKQVIGFLPYWMLNSVDLADMNYQLVSTIAYFSVGAQTDGNLAKGTAASLSTGWAGWTSSQMTDVLNRAHSNGVKVVLTVTMMAWDTAGYDRMRTFLGSSTARARLTSQIVDAVRSRQADGVNLDFEMVPSDMKAPYTAFVRQVKAALVAAGVGSALTVCVTAGSATWATGYDVAALTATGAADALFVMGYDFNWSGSARAGGVAPIDSPYVLDTATAMKDFTARTSPSKLVWGVPYYGRGWNTTSSLLNAPTTGGSWSYYYTGHRSQAATYGRRWDPVGKVPWYTYYNSGTGKWVQNYYDDAVSLGYKYDLVNQRGLAGAGVWHLLMDHGRDELWRLLADKFVTDVHPPNGGVRTLPLVTDTLAVPVSWFALDYQSGMARYNVQARAWGASSWTNWLVGTTATSGTWIGQADTVYEFRVQGIDRSGNAQPWLSAPAKPTTVRPGTFASVTTGVLNVRSGPGTGYAIVSTVTRGDRVSIISGPVSANGYRWFQVEYDFAEWPSSDYPHIGWAVDGASGASYLIPAYAPSVTRVAPFVGNYEPSRRFFSPNGDGLADGVSVSFSLRAPVSSARLDVVDASNTVVRSVSLGSLAAGAGRATWDGRLSGGGWAPQGSYLLRITAIEASGAAHVAPATNAAAAVRAAWGVTADTDPPGLVGTTPGAGATMLPASTTVTLRFDERLTGLSSATLGLRDAAGTPIATAMVIPTAGAATLQPLQPLPTGERITVEVRAGASDAAGNPVVPMSWTFEVAPGVAYASWRDVLVSGVQRGYRIGAAGDLLSTRQVTFVGGSGARVSQRATLPNLPGRWLYVENGVFAGMWLRESPTARLAGESERVAWPTGTRVTLAPGTRVGYTFDAAGRVVSSRRVRLDEATSATAGARGVINGAPYWLVTNGPLRGTWAPESTAIHHAGFVDQQSFAVPPRVSLAAGAYSGYRFDATGRRTGTVTATLASPSGAPISGSAVINGRSYWMVSAGIWRGTWLPVEPRIQLVP